MILRHMRGRWRGRPGSLIKAVARIGCPRVAEPVENEVRILPGRTGLLNVTERFESEGWTVWGVDGARTRKPHSVSFGGFEFSLRPLAFDRRANPAGGEVAGGWACDLV